MKSFYKAYREGQFKGDARDGIYIEQAAGIVANAKARIAEGYVRDAIVASAMVEMGKLGEQIKSQRLREARDKRLAADSRASDILSDRRIYASLHTLQLQEERARVAVMPKYQLAGELQQVAAGEIGASRARVIALAEAAQRAGLPEDRLAMISKGLENLRAFDPVEGDGEYKASLAAAEQLEAEAERATVRIQRADAEGESFGMPLAEIVDFSEI